MQYADPTVWTLFLLNRMCGIHTCAVSSTAYVSVFLPLKSNFFLPVPLMGEHFLQVPPAVGNDFDCTSGTPLFQILYSGGDLIGFVFSHFAYLPSDRYEKPHHNFIGGLIHFKLAYLS